MNIEIIQDIIPEVIEGFKLYAHETSRNFDEDSWLYWYKNNPYGDGVHGLAMDRGKVIGFYSLIPTEMCIANSTLIGAKGEFLVIHPDYRRKSLPNSKVPLAFDLVRITNQEAYKYNIDAVFTTATKVATLCHQYSGAKTFEFECQMFYTSFSYPKIGSRLSPIKRALIRNAVLVSTYILRFPLKLKSFKIKSTRNAFTKIENLSINDFYNDKETNYLVYPNSKMINFRFPKGKYIKYYNEKNHNYLIFTKPKHNNQVILKAWSSLDLSEDEFESVFIDLFEECRNYGAESVSMIIPNDDLSQYSEFWKYGFLSKKTFSNFNLYSRNSNIFNDLKKYKWKINEAHIGYIGFE